LTTIPSTSARSTAPTAGTENPKTPLPAGFPIVPPLANPLFPANYEVTLQLDPPAVSYGWIRSKRESTAKLGVRLSGWGAILSGKVFLDFPVGLLEANKPGRCFSTVRVVPSPTDPNQAAIETGEFTPQALDRFGIVVAPINPFVLPTRPFSASDASPQILGETVNASGFPVTVEINISKSAPEGDHPINAILTFLTSNGWHCAKASIRIHVYTWSEKWQSWIVGLGLILGAAAIAASVIIRPL